MAAETFAQLALALDGTTEAPHFDRRAFRTRRTYATLAADGQTANLKLDRDQQEHWCALLPQALAPVPNKWGAQGWTMLNLDSLAADEIRTLLRLAWTASQSPPRSRKPKA